MTEEQTHWLKMSRAHQANNHKSTGGIHIGIVLLSLIGLVATAAASTVAILVWRALS